MDVWTNKVSIYDARDERSAMANKLWSGGYENPKYYLNCEIKFNDIPNIHCVRDSYKGLINICLNFCSLMHNLTPENELKLNTRYFSDIESTRWLQNIYLILIASDKIAKELTNENESERRNVLVHCSDGWDRTS